MDQDTPATIRIAGPEDAAAICRITREAFGQYEGRVYPPFRAPLESEEQVRESIDAVYFVYGLALVGGGPVGHIRYRIARDHVHVSRLAVLPPYRRHGIGRQLMAWVEDEAARLGIYRLRGETRTVLKGLVDYYYRMGYKRVGYAPLDGVPRCLTILEKQLPQPGAVAPLPPQTGDGADGGPHGGTGTGAPAGGNGARREEVRAELLHPSLRELLKLSAHRATRQPR